MARRPPVPGTKCPVTRSTPMAHLGRKGDYFHVRFRFRGKEYKKSLKTRNHEAAQAACHLVELTLHRLHTGQCLVPVEVDPGDFIVSGGTAVRPVQPSPRPPSPSTRRL